MFVYIGGVLLVGLKGGYTQRQDVAELASAEGFQGQLDANSF